MLYIPVVTLSHGISYKSLVLSRYSHELLVSDKWDISWYTTSGRCITVLFHAIENTVTNNINAMYARCRMGRLDVRPWNIQ